MLQNYDVIISAIAEQKKTVIDGQLDFFGMMEDNSSNGLQIQIPVVEEYGYSELLET